MGNARECHDNAAQRYTIKKNIWNKKKKPNSPLNLMGLQMNEPAPWIANVNYHAAGAAAVAASVAAAASIVL